MNALLCLTLCVAAEPVEQSPNRPSLPRLEVTTGVPSNLEAGLSRRMPRYTPPTNSVGLMHDVYDAWYFSERGPIRLRLRLERDTGSFLDPWREQMRLFFDYYDRDGDGLLNRVELEMVPGLRSVGSLINSGYAMRFGNDLVAMSDIDRDGDGLASFPEFLTHYAGMTAQLVRVIPNFNRDPYGGLVSVQLQKRLDRNRDGQLQRNELQQAIEWAKLDADEDECVSALELVPELLSRPIAPNAVLAGGPQFLLTPAGQPIAGLMLQMHRHYDRNGDQLVDAKELGIHDVELKRLDANGDGKLDAIELAELKSTLADADLTFVLGKHPSIRLTRVSAGGDITLSSKAEGAALLRLGSRETITLDVFSPEVRVLPNGSAIANSLRGQFNALDPKGRGYIREDEITAGPTHQFIRVMFEPADRNCDGRLTVAEYNRFFTVADGFTRLPITMMPAVETTTLFTMLDADRDGRLSPRELRGAWERMVHLQPDCEREGVQMTQTQGRLRISNSPNGIFVNQARNVFATVLPTPQEGPTWFRKMDRNGDGEVSLREFLGSKSDFERLDTNRDNTISRSEAEAFKSP